jgi:hypothetical protein
MPRCSSKPAIGLDPGIGGVVDGNEARHREAIALGRFADQPVEAKT